MDAGAKKLLETVTIETLHANNFSRASTQATQVLTDLLSRYLTLLSTTCAKYAEHAGRLRLTARDAVSALNELGVGMEELSEYCTTEGRELSRYARHSARRIEDLNEFKAALAVGMREDHDDAIPLVYAPLLTPATSDDESDLSDSEEETEAAQKHYDIDTETGEQKIPPTESLSHAHSFDQAMSSPRPITPTLPLSPISNPSTPPRKRPRTANWEPPPYIPDFLPPFPNDSSRHEPSSPQDEDEPILHPEYSPHHHVKLERPVTPPPESSSSGSADYLRPTPYAQSSLASQPWHLPEPPPSPPRPLAVPLSQPLPQTEEAIIYALHHALTNKPPETTGPTNPARYKVALELIKQAEENPRWDPPSTLYASSAPNVPRVAAVGPAYPVPIAQDDKIKEGKDKGKDVDLEQYPPGMLRRVVISSERLAPVISSHTSTLATLAKAAVPYGLYSRSIKLSHPPVLTRGTQKLIYGPGISAPWNSGPSTPAAPPVPNGVKGLKEKEKEAKEKDAAPKPLADARLYATWNYEEKSFREPLPAGRRARMGSVQLPGPLVMGNGKRARSESHS